MTEHQNCAIHSEVMARINDRCERCIERIDCVEQRQQKSEERTANQLDRVNAKLNWFLGAAFVLWPVFQLLLSHFMKKP